jgi:hypothetical protein
MGNKETLTQKFFNFRTLCLKREAVPVGHFRLKTKAGPTQLGTAPATRNRVNPLQAILFLRR